MYRNLKTIVASQIALFLLASVPAFGADKTEVKGMIISRTGETLIVKTSEGKVTVVLDDSTQTQDRRGLFGLEKQQLGDVVLIPGLKVDIDGLSGEQGQVTAKTITVDGDDLETAEMVQSGLHPTAQQVAANVQTLGAHHQKLAGHEQDISANQQDIAANTGDIAANKGDIAASKQDISANQQQIAENMSDIQENTDRFSALSEYDVKGEATLKFKVGSTKISPEDQEQLKQLAQTATNLKGYIIEVTGYCDSTGSAAMNTQLSENRAKAVVTFLMQQGGVPVRHIVAPGAMGEYGGVAPNETAAGRAENRRVEVKVLVNKGISGV